jgi:diguanylate cyclase (GGDEF)-like protein
VERRWTLEDGLPQSSVNAVAQDGEGYLWLATYGGLARFDGVRFEVFAHADHPHLPSDRLLSLATDAAGTLWVGTERSGLTALEDGLATLFEPADGRPLDGVEALDAGPSGNLWIGSNRGLVRHGPGGSRRWRRGDGLPSDRVMSVLETSGGELWVGTDSGVVRRRGDDFEPVLDDVFAATPVQALLEDRDGAVWIGGHRGLYRWRDGATLRVPLGAAAGRVKAILQDRDGGLWVGLDPGGLVRVLDPGAAQPGKVEARSDLNVTALHEDTEGNLWIGTTGGGLRELSRGAAIAFGQPGESLAAPVVPIVPDGAGGIWAGLNCGGVVHLDAARRSQRYAAADGLTNTCVWSLLRDPESGRLWIGTSGGGLYVMPPGQAAGDGRRAVSLGGPPSAENHVQALYRAADGELLAGTDEGVFRVLGDGPGARFERLPGTAALHVVYLGEDVAGDLWIGTLNGAYVRRAGDASPMPLSPQLAGISVRTMRHDAEGTWLGTYGHGLYRWAGGQLHHLGPPQGLPENVVSFLAEDRRGRMWLTGNRGVYRLEREALDGVVKGRRIAVEAVHFGADDGMLSSECNGGGQPTGLLTEDGDLWVPTGRGVARFDTSAHVRNPAPPRVHVEAVTVDGVAHDPRRPVSLPAGARNLEIRYTGLSFTDPEGVRFRYRLEGRDRGWLEAGDRRTAYYPFLPAGENRFHVIAANADGVWNLEGASFGFTVEPRFVQTWLFWALGALAVAGISGAAAWLRLRGLRHRERQLASEVAGRTLELEETQARLRSANRRLARLATVDSLTGVPNRRGLMERLDAEWRRAIRHRRPLGLLMIDIDHFKRYNDLHGHPAGDRCLRRVAELLTAALRRADETLGRYGGEELAAVVPDTSVEELTSLAELLRGRIEETRIPHGDPAVGPHVTVSVGGAVAMPSAWDSLERLVAAADSALYAAKQEGRNRVETTDLRPPPARP